MTQRIRYVALGVLGVLLHELVSLLPDGVVDPGNLAALGVPLG